MEKSRGIGSWLVVIEVLSIISVAVNVGILWVGTNSLRGMAQDLVSKYDMSIFCRHKDDLYRVLSNSSDWQVNDLIDQCSIGTLAIVGLIMIEHLAIFLKLILRNCIRDEPDWILKETKKEILHQMRAEQRANQLARQVARKNSGN